MATPARTGSSSGKTTGSQANLTISHVATTDPLIVLAAVWQKRLGSVKFGGVDLVLGGSVTLTSQILEWWYLPAPSAGTANVVLTPESGSTWISAACYSVSGIPSVADLIAAFTWASAGGTSTAPSVAVASRTGDLVIDLVAQFANNQTYAVGGGHTKIYGQDSLANTDEKTASAEAAGAASVTMSWTLGTSGAWAIMALALPDSTTTTDQRASQVVAETALDGVTARLSQVVAETAVAGSTSRLSQLVVETATPTGVAPHRLSQVVVEVATGYLLADGQYLTIAGVVYNWRNTTMRVMQSANGTSQLNVEVLSLDSSFVAVLDSVLTLDEVVGGVTTRLFGGRISDVELGGVDDDSYVLISNKITATGMSQLAQRVVASLIIPAGTTLLAALTTIQTYLGTLGTSLSSAQVTGPSFSVDATYVDQRIDQILDDFAAKFSYLWKIDYYNVLSMYQAGTDTTTTITTANAKAKGEIKVRPTRKDYANYVKVVSSDFEFVNIRQDFIASGGIDSYTTNFESDQLYFSLWPNVLIVNGVIVQPIGWLPLATPVGWQWDGVNHKAYNDNTTGTIPAVNDRITLNYNAKVLAQRSRVEFFSGDGSTNLFTLAGDLFGWRGTVSYDAGGGAADETLGYPGDGAQWTFDPKDHTLTRSAGVPATGTNNISINYDAAFSPTAIAQDATEIALNGIWMVVIPLTDVAAADLQTYADGELDRRKRTQRGVRYDTYELGLTCGAQQTLTFPELFISGAYLITDILITEPDRADKQFKRSVTAIEGTTYLGSWRDWYKLLRG